MPESDLFTQFCTDVCRRVRCRRVRKSIAEELDAHLEDHADALRANGTEADEACRLAVAAMGDPAEVGAALDRLYPPVLYWLARALNWTAAVLLLSILGLSVLRTAARAWDDYRLFSPPPQLELNSNDFFGEPWQEMLVARGTVAGRGGLGDYSFCPSGEAWLVYVPAYDSESLHLAPYYELRFLLTATHTLPWLDDLHLDFASPTITDSAGSTARYFDGDTYLSVYAQRLTPFESTVHVAFRPPDPAQSAYTFSLTGSDGRVLTFDVALTHWEVTP